MSTQQTGVERYCLALDLIDAADAIAEYTRLHQQIWPSIAEHLRNSGVLDMQIWRLGTRLFMVMDTSPDYSAEAMNHAMRQTCGSIQRR